MTRRSLAYASAAALAAVLTLPPTTSHAALGDCSQPTSTGDNPTATDCLVLLQIAVQQTTCEAFGFPACQTCDVDSSGSVVATDALICLNKATQQPIQLNCTCTSTTVSTTTSTSITTTTTMVPPTNPQCSRAAFISKPGGRLDAGWNGLGHDAEVVAGAQILIDNLKTCSNNDAECRTDLDCSGGATCDLNCACDVEGSICNLTGPSGVSRCTRSLIECDDDGDCTAAETCQKFFGPPLPLSAGGVPTCVTTYFQENLTGTADPSTGEGTGSSFLRSVVHLGIVDSKPCPVCGAPDDNPQLGDVFTCDGPGSPNHGDPCTVRAISEEFGGVAFECPPAPANNVSGVGLAIIFKEVTTGTVEEQALLPCAPPLNAQHPDTGGGICLDDFSACDTNADCLRCTNDLSACSNDGDCSGGASCAAAPDQPIPCGIYCHCGYCDDDVDQPCFSDGDCEAPATCEPGTGSDPGGTGPLQQLQSNGCNNFLCGEQDENECCSTGDGCINANTFGETSLTGECSLATFRLCTQDSECQVTGSGVCNLSRRSCFPEKLEATGTPDPLHTACMNDPDTLCTSNADCGAGDMCVDISQPTSVGLFCVPPTASDSINAAGGIPGPGRISFAAVLVAGRCGDDQQTVDEQCDDGNLVNGDGCDQDCKIEP